jgi:hypothetical protein
MGKFAKHPIWRPKMEYEDNINRIQTGFHWLQDPVAGSCGYSMTDG